MAELHKAGAYLRLFVRAAEAVYTHRVERFRIKASEPLVHHHILRDKIHTLGGKQLRDHFIRPDRLAVENVLAVTVLKLIKALTVRAVGALDRQKLFLSEQRKKRIVSQSKALGELRKRQNPACSVYSRYCIIVLGEHAFEAAECKAACKLVCYPQLIARIYSVDPEIVVIGDIAPVIFLG